MTRTFHWFRHHQIASALKLGWVLVPCNGPMHHHEYSFLCEWLCDCEVALPL